jgi:hypothetical protein
VPSVFPSAQKKLWITRGWVDFLGGDEKMIIPRPYQREAVKAVMDK